MLVIIEWVFLALISYSIFKIVKRFLCKPNFTNKNVWITGASSGIGEFLAYEFSRLGASLIISARNQKQLQRVRLACSIPEKVTVVKLDMQNFSEIQKVTHEVLQKLQSNSQKLDIVIQNAGVSMRCLFKEYSFDNHLKMYNINVHGPFRHIQCLLPHMIKNKSGSIVGITSVAGKLASSFRSSYAGSKHAFIGILDSLRSEVHSYGIKVVNIMPGYVSTNLSKNALVGGKDEKLGFTDKNIQTGLSAEIFAKSTAKAIYNGENQLQISKGLLIPAGIFIRNLCPDLAFIMTRLNHKNQAKALEQKGE